MHISEGILSAQVLGVGAALTVVGTAVGLKGISDEKLPRVALLSSMLFVASLIHVPVGPSSVHLLLNGLTGLLLGWAAVPCVLVALALQAVLFQFGGLIVLGVNTANVALPAVICYYLFRGMAASPRRSTAFVGGFAAGALSVALTALMVALALFLTGQEFIPAAGAVLLAHVPVMIGEGFITAVVVGFLYRVKPEMLARQRAEETA